MDKLLNKPYCPPRLLLAAVCLNNPEKPRRSWNMCAYGNVTFSETKILMFVFNFQAMSAIETDMSSNSHL